MPPTVRDDMSIGERIAVWRVYRGMTQEACAGLVGKSLSWWKKVESGVRRVEKLSDIILIAQVLRVRDLVDLTGTLEFSLSVDRTADHPIVPLIRTAMLDVGGAVSCRDRPVETESLRTRIDDARSMFHRRRLFVADVGRILPELVADATTEHRRAETLPERRSCAAILSETFLLTTQVLRHAGANDLAWVAADRCMSHAQDAEDAVLIGLAVWQLSGVLKDLGRPEEGLELCHAALSQLHPLLPDGTDEQLAVAGEVELQAALMAGHCSEEGRAMRHWDAGEEATRRVSQNYIYPVTTFDHRRAGLMSVWVNIALGKPRAAIAAADRLDIRGIPSAPVRSMWLVNVARGYAARRDDIATLHVLQTAETASPETVTQSAHVREICREMLRRDRRPISRELHEFARRIGIFT